MPEKIAYRSKAHVLLKSARQNLTAGTDPQLIYAALDLRMVIECFTYELVQNYSKELSAQKLATWQPRKILQQIVDLDPHADKGASVSIGKESTPGVEAGEMHFLGTERKLSLTEIKDHYDALGHYLHIPTVLSPDAKSPDYNRLRKRANILVAIFDEIMDSPIFNINFRTTTEAPCARCGGHMLRRFPLGEREAVKGECPHCSARYNVTPLEDNQVSWDPVQTEAKCVHCGTGIWLWDDHIHVGARFKCASCGRKTEIAYGLRAVESEASKK